MHYIVRRKLPLRAEGVVVVVPLLLLLICPTVSFVLAHSPHLGQQQRSVGPEIVVVVVVVAVEADVALQSMCITSMLPVSLMSSEPC